MTGLPAGSDLVQDYLRGEPRLEEYYGRHYLDPSSFREKAEEVDRRFGKEERRRALSLIHAPSDLASSRLEAWADGDGYFVTTGQQAGLFVSPLYSLYKALSAIRLASALEGLLERPVLPLFWVASEDHDWDEVDHTHLLDVSNEIQTLRLPAPGPPPNRPVHRIPLGQEIISVREKFIEGLPQSDFSSQCFECLRKAYHPDVTLSQAFLSVMSDLLRDYPILFVDAANPGLKEASQPVLFRELHESAEHETSLAAVASELEGMGYSLGVPILPGGINLFLEGPQGRDRLYRDGTGVRLNHAQVKLSLSEVMDRVRTDPAVLSPNVLLTRVVESAVFPTLSYVGGPGEMGYFGQLKGLFAAHDMRMPVVFPRHSVVLVEAKVRKVLDKFKLETGDLDRPHHELASEIAREEVPPNVLQALGKVREAIGEGGRGLLKAAQEIDPTLKGPVTHARNAAYAAFNEAEKKILQAVKRENEIALDQLEKAERHLFPFRTPQERILNPFYYLSRYGPELVTGLMERFHVAIGSNSA